METSNDEHFRESSNIHYTFSNVKEKSEETVFKKVKFLTILKSLYMLTQKNPHEISTMSFSD